MSALTDFESLKQQIVNVVTQDPAVKYILVGWMTDEFVPRSDYNQILEELRKMRQDSNQRFAEADKRFDAVQQEIKELRKDSNQRFKAVQQEIKELREDSNRRFEEQAAETRQLRESSDRRFEELRESSDRRFEELRESSDRRFEELRESSDRRFEELRESSDRLTLVVNKLAGQVGTLTDTIGFGLEDIAKIMLPPYLEKYHGIQMKGEPGEELQPQYIPINGEEEMDLIGQGIRGSAQIKVICECKSTIGRSQVKQFQRKLARLEEEETWFKVMFGYRIHPSGAEVADDIVLVASYMR